MRTFFFCLLAIVSLAAAEKKTICLNMIVKDESEVIETCLGSVKHLIDSWVIVDTGSSDGTQEIIKKYLKDIPGELHERPWVDFSHNRNEALELAKNKADYLLMIDADEVLKYTPHFALPELDKDIYYMIVRQIDAANVKRIALIKSALDWQWEGVFHEVLQCPAAKSYAVLENVVNFCNLSQGARAKDPERAIKDARLLEKALEKDPTNSRYAFYTGMSYLRADKYTLAQKYFQKRIAMPSQDIQETYQAIYHLGIAQEKEGDLTAALQTYFKAHSFRPTRAEPLYRCAIIYRRSGNLLLGYLLSKFALSLPYPQEDLCVEYMTYDYTLLVEYANCALLLGRYQEGFEACCQLLANPNLPENIKGQVISNYALAKANLQPETPAVYSAESAH